MSPSALHGTTAYGPGTLMDLTGTLFRTQRKESTPALPGGRGDFLYRVIVGRGPLLRKFDHRFTRSLTVPEIRGVDWQPWKSPISGLRRVLKKKEPTKRWTREADTAAGAAGARPIIWPPSGPQV